MTAQILMGLGEHFFYSPRPNEPSPGFDSISQDSSFTWTSQGRLSRDPALQFTGPGDETVSIEGRLFPHLFGGLKTLENLRAAGRAGKPLMLVRYYTLRDPLQYVGENVGQFVMTRLRKNESNIGSTGIGKKIDFTMELKLYGPDAAETPEFLFQIFENQSRFSTNAVEST